MGSIKETREMFAIEEVVTAKDMIADRRGDTPSSHIDLLYRAHHQETDG